MTLACLIKAVRVVKSVQSKNIISGWRACRALRLTASEASVISPAPVNKAALALSRPAPP